MIFMICLRATCSVEIFSCSFWAMGDDFMVVVHSIRFYAAHNTLSDEFILCVL